jgi:type III restriction enzyme
MRDVAIDNPVINSPFEEPDRHFRFDEDGITGEIVSGRRVSSYFMPIAASKKARQRTLDLEETRDRLEENRLVNLIREKVGLWRRGGYLGVTPTTRRLLEYWTGPEREKRLFFCQIEALETVIYLTEVAHRFGDGWIAAELQRANDTSNPGLPRVALKMATGAGKTVVMAMLIAWQALNKLASPRDNRFTDAFLVVTPGITIRDRLRVLLPSDPDNYYRLRDLLPPDMLEDLGQAKIVITNFHAFRPREKVQAGKLTKQILNPAPGAFTEAPDEMVRRVCRELGTKRELVVINDEAHHCYRRKPDAPEEKLTGEERQEAKQRDEEARIWISGIEAIRDKIGVKTIYDLSATPFFLRGSGYSEGTLFPWVVSDFSLIDAIEAGIVKVPRVPVSDNAMAGPDPMYRGLWSRIRDGLPKKGKKTEAVGGEPRLPSLLEGALQSLYGHYKETYERWQANTEAQERGLTAPVFIVVCNNTNVSKLIYDYIGGWAKTIGDETVVQEGRLDLLRNDDGRGGWLTRPNTILVDSAQLESGEAMSAEFKQAAAREIEEFKAEYRVRFPGRDAEDLTDEDMLREVMNTVGKPGRLGEHVRCVVSVSMLTEGWDANTVTHILGVRAFGTQLLCEQVVGRALRRMSYAVNEEGRFDPEYAEVYGVPFSFIPGNGSPTPPKPGPLPTRVRALEDRSGLEITFPRVAGYRYEIAERPLRAVFDDEAKMALSPEEMATITWNEPIIGQGSVHDLADLRARRENEVAFRLARHLLETYFPDGEGDGHQFWRFPEALAITKGWLAECLHLKDGAFPQQLLLPGYARGAVEHIYGAILKTRETTETLLPILQPYDTIGSTRYVGFDTTKPVMATRGDKCHVSHVVADTENWEQKLAQTLEEMDEVVRYVKNQGLGFTVPYTMNGEERQYTPDFIACVDDGRGADDLLNLVIEVSGMPKKDKAEKVRTARNLWMPAVNNHGGFGRWDFVEVTDPYEVEGLIRSVARSGGGVGAAAD